MKNKKFFVSDLFLIVLFITSIILASTMIGVLIYSKTANKLEYKEAPIISIYTNYADEPKESKQYYKEQIEKLLNNPIYLYKEKKLDNCLGKANIVIKTVTIHNSIDIKDYIFTLTHELMHLKYFTCNERFTNFQTFKFLYESGIPEFEYVALWYAKKDMSGKTYHEYSCWGYISEYLQNKTIDK